MELILQKLPEDKNLKIASLASLLLFFLLGIAFLRSSYQTIPSNIFNGAMFLVFVVVVGYVIKVLKKPQEIKSSSIDSVANIDKKVVEDEVESKESKPIAIKPNSSINFDSVVGIEYVKDELLEIVDFIKNPKKYRDLGISLPKGVLLVGPPGVGKTLVAKALATESNVPFFYQSGASFTQIYVGMGAKKVQELFNEAKKSSPAIIFIDEIDSIGGHRGKSDERDATLNQLLTELDGFIDSSGVILIGATNRVESLDEALLRSGRFDRRVYLELPNLQDREKLINYYLKNQKHLLDIDKVSQEIAGFSGASVATLINEAKLSMIRRNSKVLEYIDILDVKDRVIFGNRSRFFTKDEKEILSIYKSAKAYIAKDINSKLDKFTLYNEYVDINFIKILSKDDLHLQLKYYLSGYVACRVIKNQIYSISKDDIARAKKLANKYVNEYCMSDSFICSSDDVERVLQDINYELKTKVDFSKIEKLSAIMFEKESLSRDELEEN
jgi:ATP-dependent metalloprotease FtsH